MPLRRALELVQISFRMKIPLQTARARWPFFLAIFLISGGFSFVAGKIWLAAHWGGSWDQSQLQRAASLEPSNADYWYRLGFLERWNFERGDPRRAVVFYRRATEANSYSDKSWMDLADAFEALGESDRAGEAFARAQSAHPISPEVAWRYGNFLLRRGDSPAAFAEIRRALATDPSLTVQAVAECSKTSGDLPRILTAIFPGRSDYYFMALGYFLSQHQTEAALVTWEQLLGLRQTFEMANAVPLIDRLINQERVEDAVRVWQQALRATSWPHDSAVGSSLVFNGGFEHPLLNGAFDWREDPVSGADFSFDSNVVHSGARSLQVSFDGNANLDFQNLRQFSPVEPSHRYHFAAFLRTEGISTDSGIRFAIYDAFHPEVVPMLTSDLVGTHSWSLVETDLLTGPDTHLLAISLRRLPSWKFDRNLRGTVWVDDVSLEPASGSARVAPR